MVMISLVSIAVLTLLLTIQVRGRKKEIGILLSVGTDKAGIVAQFFAETLIAGVIALALTLPSLWLCAGKAGEFVISKVAAGTPDLEIHMQLSYLLPISLIGIGLIAISVLAASWTLIRLKPRDILSKMS